MQYLVDLDFYGSVSPYSTKTMESFGTIMGKKVFQETRKALKVRRTAVGDLLVDMPEHICFRVSFFCGTQIETNHWQKKNTTIKGKYITTVPHDHAASQLVKT